MPTGWRPSDVAERSPIGGVLGGADVYAQVKYDPRPTTWVMAFAWAQFAVVQLAVVHLFTHLDDLGWEPMMSYGLWLFLGLFALTSLLDGTWWAVLAEALRLVTAAAAVLAFGGWFGAEAYLPGAAYWVLAWSGGSLAATAYAYVATDPQPAAAAEP